MSQYVTEGGPWRSIYGGRSDTKGDDEEDGEYKSGEYETEGYQNERNDSSITAMNALLLTRYEQRKGEFPQNRSDETCRLDGGNIMCREPNDEIKIEDEKGGGMVSGKGSEMIDDDKESNSILISYAFILLVFFIGICIIVLRNNSSLRWINKYWFLALIAISFIVILIAIPRLAEENRSYINSLFIFYLFLLTISIFFKFSLNNQLASVVIIALAAIVILWIMCRSCNASGLLIVLAIDVFLLFTF